jgi:hypothetical protein
MIYGIIYLLQDIVFVDIDNPNQAIIHPAWPGVGDMKRGLTFLMILCMMMATGVALGAFDGSVAEMRIRQIQDSLEQQVERIRDARDRAGTRMSLAKIRISEDLARSQDDLQRQIEMLERLREQLSEQSAKSEEAVEQLRNDWSQRFATAFQSIETQIAETNELMRRFDAIRERMDAGQGEVSMPTNGLPTVSTPTSESLPTVTPPSVEPTTTTTVAGNDPTTVTPTAVTPSTSPLPTGG